MSIDLTDISLEGRDILIVDDTPENLRLLVGILKNRKYKVRPAPNGKTALAAVKASRPDLILLDINMPGLNGYQVCRILKEDEFSSDIPVIFISAMHENVDKVKAFEAGGIDYITKPFFVDEVLARVETHLKLSLFQKKLETANELLEIEVEERTEENIKLNEVRQRMRMELKIAKNIQFSMLPKPDRLKSASEYISIHGCSIPAKIVGGDFYDFFMLDENSVFFCLGDVSGKGVPAALFMAIIMTHLKVQAKRKIMPHEIIRNVNSLIVDDNETCMFASVLCGIIDLSTGVVRYCNAGHTPPLMLRGVESYYVSVQKETVIGIMQSDECGYTTEEEKFEPGDKLLLYSDGVTEAVNTAKEQYKKERLMSSFNSVAVESEGDNVIKHIENDINEFTKLEPQFDDITMMLINLKSFKNN